VKVDDVEELREEVELVLLVVEEVLENALEEDDPQRCGFCVQVLVSELKSHTPGNGGVPPPSA
jgi:hypothetical protein